MSSSSHTQSKQSNTPSQHGEVEECTADQQQRQEEHCLDDEIKAAKKKISELRSKEQLVGDRLRRYQTIPRSKLSREQQQLLQQTAQSHQTMVKEIQRLEQRVQSLEVRRQRELLQMRMPNTQPNTQPVTQPNNQPQNHETAVAQDSPAELRRSHCDIFKWYYVWICLLLSFWLLVRMVFYFKPNGMAWVNFSIVTVFILSLLLCCCAVKFFDVERERRFYLQHHRSTPNHDIESGVEGTSTLLANESDNEQPKQQKHRSVEAVVERSRAGERLGIIIRTLRNKTFVVRSIEPNSPFYQTPLREGMVIKSINGIEVKAQNEGGALEILTKFVGRITVVAEARDPSFPFVSSPQHQGLTSSPTPEGRAQATIISKEMETKDQQEGAPLSQGTKYGETTLNSSISPVLNVRVPMKMTFEKSSTDDDLGLKLKTNHNGDIIVHQVNQDSLLLLQGTRKLEEGMQVITINGVHVKGFSVEFCMQLLAGSHGTIVLEVEREESPTICSTVTSSTPDTSAPPDSAVLSPSCPASSKKAEGGKDGVASHVKHHKHVKRKHVKTKHVKDKHVKGKHGKGKHEASRSTSTFGKYVEFEKKEGHMAHGNSKHLAGYHSGHHAGHQSGHQAGHHHPGHHHPGHHHSTGHHHTGHQHTGHHHKRVNEKGSTLGDGEIVG